MSASGYDRDITVFSPEGILYQVVYTFKAVKTAGITSFAIKGKDCVVVLSQKKVSDALCDASYVKFVHSVTKNVYMLVTGRQADGKAILMSARSMANEFQNDYGYEIPAQLLAQKIADKNQAATQEAWRRPLGVSCVLFSSLPPPAVSVDEEEPVSGIPVMYHVDPAGFFSSVVAMSMGTKDSEGCTYLERVMRARKERQKKEAKRRQKEERKEEEEEEEKGEKRDMEDEEEEEDMEVQEGVFGELTAEKCCFILLSTVHYVLGEGVKASDVEMYVCDKDGLKRKTDSEVDDLLGVIAESE
ncbi:Proteasome, subunit alpha/beta like protein [Aduncisulcus paluster]|uniref:Proteasome, subunit alpha/beta like protein n=1 Tax=Aduncisulcus paluster TaxID=2918883 RepID=A0ABQ5KB02_9EUKA|nr:Proteasome, subunit alpha/beta like protein [Aduncisulcus paluster]